MHKRHQYRFQALTDHVEAMIAGGYYQAGARIPSIRELCEQFQLSRGTVCRGLEYLRERNVIELQHGSGAYVKSTVAFGKKETGKVAIFSEWADPSSYCGHILLGIQRQAESLNILLSINLIKYYNLTYDLLENIARSNDALMLVGPYDGCIDRLPPFRPAIGIDMQNSMETASILSMDPMQNAEAATKFFRRHGLKKVKVFGFPLPLYRFRAEVFASFWQNHGGTAEIFGNDGSYPEVYSQKLPLRFIEEVNDPDCGYFFASGSLCNSILEEYLHRHGRKMTDDFCILAIDGKSLLVPGFQPVNTIAPDYCELGSLALRECLRRMENPGTAPRRLLVAGQLHELPLSRIITNM